MTSFNGIPVVSIPGTISSTPVNYGSPLQWNTSTRYYQWTLTLSVPVTQKTSGVYTRQKLLYSGIDVYVGQWIANISTGQAWQIISISSKSASSVTCVVEDIYRYNTYRDVNQSGNGRPGTGSYVVFTVSSDGTPIIDPTPSAASSTFGPSLTSRFRYISTQNDFVLQQSDLSTVNPSVSLTNGGTGYNSGGSATFFSVPLTGGTGQGALATIVVTSGVVTAVTITFVGNGNYVAGDVLSASNVNLGGTGSGFSTTIIFVFAYGDVIAVDQATGNFVLADATYQDIIGTVTGVDDAGVNFSVNLLEKVNYLLDYLPGNVGDYIYSDTTVPGGLTTSIGGTKVYLKLRNNTQSNTVSSTFVAPTDIVSANGYVFNINGYPTTVGGTGTLTDVNTAINAISSITGISSTVAGTYYLQVTAVDARPIIFFDVSGGTVSVSGLVSVENGIKAAGLYITNSRGGGSSPVTGFTFVQISPNDTWSINHGENSSNYILQVFDATGTVILPDEITTIDVNNVQVTFSAPQDGKAQLSIFS